MLGRALLRIVVVMFSFVFSHFRQENALKCTTDIIKGLTASRFVKVYFLL